MSFTDWKLQEATAQVEELINRVYGPFIEEVVRETNQPELAPNLRNLFSKYLLLEHSIKKAKLLEDFETYIERAARLLERRIAEAHKKIAYLTEIEKAKLKEERAKLTSEFYSLSIDSVSIIDDTEPDYNDQEDEELRQILKEANEAGEGAFRALEGIFDGSEELDGTLVSIDKSELQAGLKKFRTPITFIGAIFLMLRVSC